MRVWNSASARAGRPWLGLVAVVVGLTYLSNPGAGLCEWIPDGAPLVGNLDEVAFAGLLFLGLRWVFGTAPTA